MPKTSVSRDQEIARRIREGQERRWERQERLRTIREAYVETVSANEKARESLTAAAYLPMVLVFILSVSLPLSEHAVDWPLVGLFTVVDLGYACVVSEPSHWMSVVTVALANLVLVRLSPLLGDLPALLRLLEPMHVVLFIAGHALLGAVLYFGYVGRRMPLSAATCDQSPGKSLNGPKRADIDAAELEAFLRETDRMWRSDVAMALVLAFDVCLFMYCGLLPHEKMAAVFRNMLRLIT